MSDIAQSLAPVRKSVVVPVDQARAFDLFTARFGEWWPLATHSVGLDDAVSVSFPSAVGQPIVETLRDGTTSVWGTLTLWDPPTTVGYSWHAGQSESLAGNVEIRFVPAGTAATVVELTHAGWERRHGAGQL